MPPNPYEYGGTFHTACMILRRESLGLIDERRTSTLLRRLEVETEELNRSAPASLESHLYRACLSYMNGQPADARGTLHPILSHGLDSEDAAILMLDLLVSDNERQDLWYEYVERLYRTFPKSRLISHSAMKRFIRLNDYKMAGEVSGWMYPLDSPDHLFGVCDYKNMQGDNDGVTETLISYVEDTRVEVLVGLFSTIIADHIYSYKGTVPVVGRIMSRLFQLRRLHNTLDDHLIGSSRDTVIRLLELSKNWRDAALVVEEIQDQREGTPSDQQSQIEMARGLAYQFYESKRYRSSSLTSEYVYQETGEINSLIDSLYAAVAAFDVNRAKLLAELPRPTVSDHSTRQALAHVLLTVAKDFAGSTTATNLKEQAIALDASTASSDEVRLVDFGVPAWELSERHVIKAVSQAWANGDFSGATVLAREAAFRDHIGSAPMSVVVDLLVEAGRHASANHFAMELLRHFPDDPMVQQKVSMVNTWAGNPRSAAQYARACANPDGRRILVYPELLQWYATFDKAEAAVFRKQAMNDSRYRRVRGEL